MKPTVYTVVLISEHKQALHEERKHPMCSLCNTEEAKLLDQLKVCKKEDSA